MLISALLAATVVISPTWRTDNVDRNNFGVTVGGYASSRSLWSGALFYEHARANTFTSGSTAYLVPRVQTLGTELGYELGGKTYYKSPWGWVRSGSRVSLVATVRVGARRFSYDFPEYIGPETRRWILSHASTGYFVTPGFTSRISIARPLALQFGVGWEFGSSPREYRRLQSTVGISTQF